MQPFLVVERLTKARYSCSIAAIFKHMRIHLGIIFALVGLGVFSQSALSQGVIPTKGKEFWLGFMENYEVESWQEALNVFITSDQNTTGTITVPLQGWSQNFTVTANQTTTVTIPNNIGEVYSNQVVEPKGIFIETQDTVAVFAINFNGYTADGTKILPTKTLGTYYRVATYSGILGAYPSEFMIVATEDDTEVEIIPSVATAGGNAAGVPFTVQLDAGQAYQVQSQIAEQDFTGTIIQGTPASGECRPFAVFSGVSCTNVYPGCYACDHIYDQNWPIQFWGTDYYIVPFDFTTDYTYRVLAHEDNTTVNIDGSIIVLDAGDFYEDNEVPGAVCVLADKPVCVIQYMQGADCGGTGDPAMMILNSSEQRIDNITFSTVESAVIQQHGLSIVVRTQDVGTVAVDGSLIPAAQFSTFPSCPDFSFAQFPVNSGSHTMTCPNGATGYVYGTGGYESYAYSVGSYSPQPPLNIDSVLCTADTVNLAMIGGYSNVEWYAMSDTTTVIGTGPQLTLYPPIVSDIYVAYGDQFISGCTEEQYFAVEVPEPPVLEMFQSLDEICQYQEVQLNVIVTPPSNIYEYLWEPAAGLSDPTIPNPVATPLQSTWYKVTVSTPTGCGTNSDSLYIEVLDGFIMNFDAETDIDMFCLGGEAHFTTDIQEVIFEEDFDPAISWGLWSGISGGAEDFGCGTVSGNALWFNASGTRSASTINLNVLNGGTLEFTIRIGTGSFPCDNVDPGEDVVVEYSINNGVSWTIIQTLQEFAYPNLTPVSIDIPPAAQTASTRFRWRQLANSGVDQDNWTLDNIFIGASDPAGYDFAWTPDYMIDDPTSATPTVTPEEDTMYFVEVYDPVYGCTYTDSILIQVGQPFTLAMTPDTIICDISGIPLEAVPSVEDGDYIYNWFPEDGSLSSTTVESPVATPQQTTFYSVNVSNEEGCWADGGVTITVNQLFDLIVETDLNNFCAGETAQLLATVTGNVQGLVYEWSPADYLSDTDIPNPTTTPPTSITYTINVTDPIAGCTLSEEVEFIVYESFDLIVTPDTSLCTVQGFQLNAEPTAGGPFVWEWTPSNVLSNGAIPNPIITQNVSESFTVTATDGGGCFVTETVDIQLLFSILELGPDQQICEGETVTLSANFGPDNDFEWSTGETTASIEVTESGNYFVTVTSPLGCEATDALNVVVHQLPNVNLGPDQSLCEGEQAILNAQNVGSDYLWSNGQISQAVLLNESGEYWVQVTDFFDCVSSDTVSISFYENPVINLPEVSTICESDFITLDAENAGSAFSWSNGASSQTITVNQEAIYSVTVTNEWGCVSEDESALLVETYPLVNLGPDQAYCEDVTLVLDAGNPGLNFDWSTGEDTQQIVVEQTGNYEVTVDNGYCFTEDEISVVFYPNPDPNLGLDTSMCFNDPPYSLFLNAGNQGSLFIWSTGETSQSISVDNGGLFWVQVINPFGCSGTDSVYVYNTCVGDFLYIPNAFTPDNDGFNDAFFAKGENITDFEMEIYNRWGELVFESDNIQKAWDGSFLGGEHYVESEVYVWVVRYKYVMDAFGNISDWTQIRGHVTVIR